MTSTNSPSNVLAETRSLSQRMRSAYDVSRSTATIGDVAVSLDALRTNLSSLIVQAKIRIHKASVNQTAPLTEKQAKMLNDAIYSASSILRKQEQLASAQNRKRTDHQKDTLQVSGEDFQEQMANLNKQLNAVSIEMAKLKRANDNIMNIYSNYMLENEEECDSDEEEDESDSGEENNTIYKRD
ncbi:AAEL006896-PA [Aedes aegypti]|uniref:AAEL006896-PA n=2 Tax=Aedes aegypti TaxID=7159 RepID=A0A1S4FKT1_AEDAE|nr:uncharacterized protein LOC5571214 [Aedes aegypti]EAT41456.1 AAEL006896-PA [Aedes aegypti]